MKNGFYFLFAVWMGIWAAYMIPHLHRESDVRELRVLSVALAAFFAFESILRSFVVIMGWE